MHRLAHLGVRLVDSNDGRVLVQKGSESSLMNDVKVKQDLDPKLVELKKLVVEKNIEAFSLKEDGILRYQDRLCVSDVDGLKDLILEEDHGSKYFIHPGSTKMYHDIKEIYWWHGMKKDIAEFVAQCTNCQHVKVEHQKPDG